MRKQLLSIVCLITLCALPSADAARKKVRKKTVKQKTTEVVAPATSTVVQDPPVLLEDHSSSENFFTSFKNKLNVTYFGQFSGPSIGDPNNTVPTQDLSSGGDNVSLYNSIGIGYKFSPTFKAGINPRFLWEMLRGTGQDLSFLNVRVFAKLSNIITTDQFNVSSTVNSELPTSLAASRSNLLTAPALYFTGSFTPRNFKELEIGTTVMLRTYFYSDDSTGKRNFQGYAGPAITYKFNSKLHATALYELIGNHISGRDLNDWDSGGSWIQPGIIWNVSDNWSFNPYIQIYPAGHLNSDTTSLGLYISGTLL